MEGRARTYNWTPYHSNTEKADRERSIHKASSDRYGVNVRRSVKAQYACRQARQSSGSGSKLIFLIAVSAMLLFAGIVFFSGMTPSGMSVVEANQQFGELQYRIIEIQKGDSLWSIAKENMNPGFNDIFDYIREVKRCNQLDSDKITAGNYLMIPYYE